MQIFSKFNSIRSNSVPHIYTVAWRWIHICINGRMDGRTNRRTCCCTQQKKNGTTTTTTWKKLWNSKHISIKIISFLFTLTTNVKFLMTTAAKCGRSDGARQIWRGVGQTVAIAWEETNGNKICIEFLWIYTNMKCHEYFIFELKHNRPITKLVECLRACLTRNKWRCHPLFMFL